MMQFKHPELLYALILLLIPLIVHLFQLRRFQKVPFTNVDFLKQVNRQTRKSRVLKKWLTLITRMLIVACVVIAFAQPFSSRSGTLDQKSEIVIYIDNSFSMQAMGSEGELFRRAVQDLLGSDIQDQPVTVFTNDSEFRSADLKSIRNDLIQMEYSGSQLDYEAAILKGRQLFSNDNSSLKHLILVSDFQQNRPLNLNNDDSLAMLNLVQLKAVNQANASIDTAYISRLQGSTIDLRVRVNHNGLDIENLPVALFNDEQLLAKSAIDENSGTEVIFTLPSNETINGRLSLEDGMLRFDNTLYFNLNEREKINVLAVNEADDSYLKGIFTNTEFNFISVGLSQLNFNDINEQNLIVLNELKVISPALVNAITAFAAQNGTVLIIPSDDPDLYSYNQLLQKISNISMKLIVPSERNITKINFEHPLYEDVFDNQIRNFQYPKVNFFIQSEGDESPILSFSDNSPFLMRSGQTFVFTSALNNSNSNFTNSPLIVPTLYNIGRQGLNLPKLYYTVGAESQFDVKTRVGADDILKLKMDDEELIPRQQSFQKKVTIYTEDSPSHAGIFEVVKGSEVIERVSFNYDRKESELSFYDLQNQTEKNVSDSLTAVLADIKSSSEINALWKWFAIFALVFLLAEMLILKLLK